MLHFQSFYVEEEKRREEKVKEKKQKNYSFMCSRVFVKRRENFEKNKYSGNYLKICISASPIIISFLGRKNYGEKIARTFFLDLLSSLPKKLGSNT